MNSIINQEFTKKLKEVIGEYDFYIKGIDYHIPEGTAGFGYIRIDLIKKAQIPDCGLEKLQREGKNK